MKIFIAIALLFGLLIACNSTNSDVKKSTMSRGESTIYIDDSFIPYLTGVETVFEGSRPNADIKLFSCSEFVAKRDLIAGKTNSIVIGTDFTDAQKKSLVESGVAFQSQILARDAIVFVVNTSNADSLLTEEFILGVLKGENKTWPSSKNEISVLFDNVQSANFNYFLDKLKLTKFPKNIYAVRSNNEVINYVKKYPNTIGVIGYNWISDQDEPIAMYNRTEVRVVALAKGNGKDYKKAYQAYVQDQTYPFIRYIWNITKATPDGLEAGLMNFMTNQKGQILADKCGLIPYKQYPRVLQFQIQ